MFEFHVPAGMSVAAGHSHDGYEETIYGLEGVLTWTVEGTPLEVGPGDVLLVPRGAVHQFDNTSGEDARALAVVTPGILGPGYFREVAAILDAAAGGPPDFEALGEVMRRTAPLAPLSRAQAATRGSALVVNLPGSERGARENLSAVLPLIPHALQLLAGDTKHT